MMVLLFYTSWFSLTHTIFEIGFNYPKWANRNTEVRNKLRVIPSVLV